MSVEDREGKYKTYTVRIRVKDEDEAVWIHEHLKQANPTPFNGIQVTAISTGDMFGELDAITRESNIYHAVGHTLLDEEETKQLDTIEKEIEAAGQLWQ